MREGTNVSARCWQARHTKRLLGVPPENGLRGASENAIESPRNYLLACSRLSGNWTRSKAICCHTECIKRLRYEDGPIIFRQPSRLGCNRFGRSPRWVKVKNPNAPAVKREAEEDWGRRIVRTRVRLSRRGDGRGDARRRSPVPGFGA
jgi:hypothetical protein